MANVPFAAFDVGIPEGNGRREGVCWAVLRIANAPELINGGTPPEALPPGVVVRRNASGLVGIGGAGKAPLPANKGPGAACDCVDEGGDATGGPSATVGALAGGGGTPV